MFATLALVVGCSDPALDESEDSAGNAVIGSNSLAPNSLAPNSLAPNSLAPNSLAPNSLAPNSLAPNSLSPEALSALLDPGGGGDRARMLVRYLVGCALTPEDTFAFSWIDEDGLVHDEAYSGQLGLAPGWRSAPLDPGDQAIVSACAAARTNYYGVQVEISMRSPAAPLSKPDAAELGAFPAIEGAFWGNLFAPGGPALRACYSSENRRASRKWLRDCASGHVDRNGLAVPCAHITIVGSCEHLCEPLDPDGRYYPSCTDPAGGAVDEVITTSLPPAPELGSGGDLAVTTTAPKSVSRGACTRVLQTIKVVNHGWAPAPVPIVTHTLPDGAALVEAVTRSGSCSAAGGSVTCTLGTLAPSDSATITVAATPTAGDAEITGTSFAVADVVENDASDNVSRATTAIVPPAYAGWETITSEFNDTPIQKGQTVWFTVAMKPNGLPSSVSRVWGFGGKVRFTANGTTYTLPLPDAELRFDPAAKKAATKYDAKLRKWVTGAPKSFSGNAFASAAAFVAPVDLPGGISPVTVSMRFATDKKGVKPKWAWSAAVYGKLDRDYSLLLVQPTDDGGKNPSGNSDHAGTPEAFKGFLVCGAKGHGDKDYTGGPSQAKDGNPELVSSCK